MKNMDELVKNQRISKKADILKLEALEKEQIVKVKQGDATGEEKYEVNALLFESLEAKLTLLNEFNKSIE